MALLLKKSSSSLIYLFFFLLLSLDFAYIENGINMVFPFKSDNKLH